MRQPLSSCDIPQTPALRLMALDLGVEVDLMYWNASIPREVVLTLKGQPFAVIASTPETALRVAEKTINSFGGL